MRALAQTLTYMVSIHPGKAATDYAPATSTEMGGYKSYTRAHIEIMIIAVLW